VRPRAACGVGPGLELRYIGLRVERILERGRVTHRVALALSHELTIVEAKPDEPVGRSKTVNRPASSVLVNLTRFANEPPGSTQAPASGLP
jgi:hypothetical protein